LKEPTNDRRVTPEQLGLRKLPSGWSGAPLSQLVASARKIVEQSEATGGTGDPRLRAALKVLDFKESSEAKKK
jgi:hypothetical protein